MNKKEYKKIHIFEAISIVNLKNFLQTPSLDDKFCGNLTFSNSIIFVEDLIRWNKGFEIFLIDHYAGENPNKNIAGKYQLNSCISVTHPILGGKFHTGYYIYNSLVYVIYLLFICMQQRSV